MNIILYTPGDLTAACLGGLSRQGVDVNDWIYMILVTRGGLYKIPEEMCGSVYIEKRQIWFLDTGTIHDIVVVYE